MIKSLQFLLYLFYLCLAFPLFGQWTVSDSLLRKHVGALAHDSMQGRMTGKPGAAMAAAYIAGQMDSIGLKRIAGFDNSFLMPWSGKMNGITGDHVIGIVPGAEFKDSMYIFTAHYDHVGYVSAQKALPFGFGTKKVKGDTIFNGANDDATGVAAMLELARVFAGSKPAYTLLFVAFCGEEFGLWGSEDFVADLRPRLVKMNINLEMLGRSRGQKPYVTEPKEGDGVLNLLNQNLAKSGAGYPRNYFTEDPYPEQNLYKRSDNYSFYKRDIRAYTIMATDPLDSFYHSSDDEFETIQFDAMTKIVQAIVLAIKPMVLGE